MLMRIAVTRNNTNEFSLNRIDSPNTPMMDKVQTTPSFSSNEREDKLHPAKSRRDWD